MQLSKVYKGKLSTLLSFQAGSQLALASSKVSRSVFSDSPDIPETIVGADILMKGRPIS